jgi:hypothetical protein
MNKQTGLTVTIIVGVLTFLCCTLPLCLAGMMIFADLGEWSTDVGGTTGAGTIAPAYGVAPCCLSILVLVVPLLLWFFLVRGKDDASGGTPQY